MGVQAIREERRLNLTLEERIRAAVARHPEWDDHRVANAIEGTRVAQIAEIRAAVQASASPSAPELARLQRKVGELEETLALVARRERPYEVPAENGGNTLRFGVVADTQIGSLYQRIDALRAFYTHCGREGISVIFHAGDVLDGWRVYRGQEFELHPQGKSWEDQLAMFAESVPRIDGIVTHFITGNHDRSYKKLIGIHVGRALQKARPDWSFIGEDVGDIVLKANRGQEFKVRLVHPGGGTSYAISYRLQKFIEAIPGGEKPDLLVVGHYHKAEFLPDYRNVAGIQAGTFQSQTPFMATQAIAAHVGGWVIEVALGDRKKLSSRIRAEFLAFYEAQK